MFVVVPNYFKDSVIINFSLKYANTTIKYKHLFGFFDGKDMFINDKEFGIRRNLFDFSQKFLKLNYVGRYPFLVVDIKRIYLGGGLSGLLVGAADAFASPPKEEVWYFNKNGRSLKATTQSVGFLVSKDKDFTKEFNSEKPLNNNAFIKYIIKMNKRYPY